MCNILDENENFPCTFLLENKFSIIFKFQPINTTSNFKRVQRRQSLHLKVVLKYITCFCLMQGFILCQI